MQIMDGKALSKKLFEQMKQKVAGFSSKPGLTVILVGDDPASAVYVKNKHLACETVGIQSHVLKLHAETQKNELIQTILELNSNPNVHGILIQLPLPKHLPTEEILAYVSETKDVDAFHTLNAGKLFRGLHGILPCTPKGIIRLLKEYQVEISGKNAVVIGRSNIVGKPVAMLLLQENATVTICHSQTPSIEGVTRQADILIAAVGRPEMVKASWIKDGACVVDVGMNRNAAGKLVGDVAYDGVSRKASFITPVPGGVGPMTIAMLLENTIEAFQQLSS